MPVGNEEKSRAKKNLSPAARRALEEAEQRREARKSRKSSKTPREVDGRGGPEPTRYGDWEKDGIASDF